jgi:hypothetical protein
MQLVRETDRKVIGKSNPLSLLLLLTLREREREREGGRKKKKKTEKEKEKNLFRIGSKSRNLSKMHKLRFEFCASRHLQVSL